MHDHTHTHTLIHIATGTDLQLVTYVSLFEEATVDRLLQHHLRCDAHGILRRLHTICQTNAHNSCQNVVCFIFRNVREQYE